MWQVVAALLVARALQLQRVCLDLAILGYSRELIATARSMSNARTAKGVTSNPKTMTRATVGA